MISADNNKPSGARSVALLCLAPVGDGSAHLTAASVECSCAPFGDHVDGYAARQVKRLYGPVLSGRGKHTAMLLCALLGLSGRAGGCCGDGAASDGW